MLKFLESLHLAYLFVTFYLGLDICLILETIQVTYLFYRVPLGIYSDSLKFIQAFIQISFAAAA